MKKSGFSLKGPTGLKICEMKLITADYKYVKISIFALLEIKSLLIDCDNLWTDDL